MSKNCNKNNAPRNGTNRLNRLPKALDASFVAIDERDKTALYQFSERLSAYIKYYYFDAVEHQSDWQTVFNASKLNEFGLTEPHLALFDSFLEIYAIAQKDLNQFTAKHLNYFYETVLGFEKKKAQPDKVYLLVELAKHITQYVLEEGTDFKGGKNGNKKEQFYALLSAFSFSHAEVAQLKSVWVDLNEKSKIYASPIANSGDGMGSELKNSDGSWETFGDESRPAINLGFALSSPLFRMAEGLRKITLTITYASNYSFSSVIDKGSLKASATSEKGWIDLEIMSATFKNSKQLEIVIQANQALLKIVDFHKDIHLEYFKSKYPIIKLAVVAGENVYQTLNYAEVNTIRVDTSVAGVKNLIVQNSLGKLDAAKPMELFGSTPTLGSNFYIGSSEVFQHKLNSLTLNFQFVNLPKISLSEYYKLYINPKDYVEVSKKWKETLGNYQIGIKSLSEQEISKIKNPISTARNTLADIVGENKAYPSKNATYRDNTPQYVNNSSFKVEISYLNSRNWILPTPISVSLFGLDDVNSPKAIFNESLGIPTVLKPDYQTDAGEGYGLDTKRGYIKLKFSSGTFGHSDYQLAFSRSVMGNLDDPMNLELPNAPYTPLIQDLSLDYTCSTTLDFSSSDANTQINYEQRTHSFFYVDTFGVAEMHPFTDGKFTLLAKKETEGALLIGLSNVVVPQQISLLFKVSEGSANPDFNKALVRWYYLDNNHWKPFEKQQILREQTNGLLTSGIVTLAIPKTATIDNTLLSPGYIWIQACAQKDAKAVCDIISIDAQACEAAFSFYEDVLPENIAIAADTISKLKIADAAIKKVKQPYSSFNGRPAEEGNKYYLRVSERLRHKNRAITQWDIERLILAHFNQVYTVKCINHTFYNGSVATYNSLSPGQIAIIAVPDVSIANAPDPLQPKVSKNTLEEIKAYLGKINSVFAELHVQNPIYEQIKVDFHVKFRNGYEENIYLPRLQEKINQLLAPWTGNSDVQLELGGKIEKSTLIYQLEKLSYVDYVTCFKMYLFRPAGLENISFKDIEKAEAATSASILTAYPTHRIVNVNDINDPDCDCADCDDNIVKTNDSSVPINECGCK